MCLCTDVQANTSGLVHMAMGKSYQGMIALSLGYQKIMHYICIIMDSNKLTYEMVGYECCLFSNNLLE